MEVLGGLLVGAVGRWVGVTLIPSAATKFQNFWYPAFGSIAGVCLGLGGTFLLILFWNLFRAPYRQRDEAILALDKLSQTPLKVEYFSQGYQLVGKNWLGRELYLRHFNVILTNTSDTQEVSTKAVFLEVRYKEKNGNVRSYVLSLIPDVDKDNYGRVSSAEGKLLKENEYLNHRDSRRGFYQFLDGEAPFAPKLIQTWPTLVIVDSFDAPHRKEFSQSRFASRLSPDKGGSPT